MGVLSVFALAVGLAMDATAVAAAKGFAADRLSVWLALRVGLLFGAFQAGMPLLGSLVGARFAATAQAWDHWLAFALLAGIGAKMLYDVLGQRSPASGSEVERPSDAFAWHALIVLAVATSIDALVAGMTLPVLSIPVVLAAATIGVVTAALSTGGVYLGRTCGARVGRKLDAFGGVLLIALGTKVLVEHLYAS